MHLDIQQFNGIILNHIFMDVLWGELRCLRIFLWITTFRRICKSGYLYRVKSRVQNLPAYHPILNSTSYRQFADLTLTILNLAQSGHHTSLIFISSFLSSQKLFLFNEITKLSVSRQELLNLNWKRKLKGIKKCICTFNISQYKYTFRQFGFSEEDIANQTISSYKS